MNPHHNPLQNPNMPSDVALRALYGDAQTQMSGGTLARLHQRRHAALQAPARRRSWALPLVASCAALFALAVGLQFMTPSELAPTTAPAPVIAAVASDNTETADAVDDAVAAYDESPDFYLWLAANEATLLAAE